MCIRDRDTGVAKRKRVVKAPAAVRMPLAKFGAVKKSLRKAEKIRVAYAAAPVSLFPGDDGREGSFADFELPRCLLAEYAKGKVAEKARVDGKRSLAVAMARATQGCFDVPCHLGSRLSQITRVSRTTLGETAEERRAPYEVGPLKDSGYS